MPFKKNLALIYGVSFLTGLVPYLSLPFITKILSVKEFGFFNLLQYSAYFILPLLTLGYQTGLRKYYSEFPDNFSGSLKVVSELLLRQFFLILLLMAALNYLLNGNGYSIFEILVVLISTVAIGAVSFVFIYWHINERFLYAAIFNLLMMLSLYAITFCLLLYGWSSYSRAYALIMVYTLFVFFSLFLIYKNTKNVKKVERASATHKSLLNIGLPLAFFSALDLLVINFDKWMILAYEGEYELGLYSAYFYFYMLVFFLAKPLSIIVEIKLFKNDRQAIKMRSVIILLFSLLGIFLFLFNEQIIVTVFSEEYASRSHVLVIIYIAAIFKLLITFQQIDLVIFNRQKDIVFRMIFITILSLALLAVLVSKYGIYGAAIGVLLYEVMIFISNYIKLSTLKEWGDEKKR